MSIAPAPGQLLEGKYKIERTVGEGAWGEVLEGINVRIQRRVAIKILKAEYAAEPTMVSRFEREALASTHIESPHVVQVFDAGVLEDGRPYMVMEFLTGEDLNHRIERLGQMPIFAAVELCIQAARGLSAAHQAGIFHRDMKPSNIVIAKTKSGKEIAKIVDFGISKLLDANKEPSSATQTGTILGSPAYMSPEQARGAKTTDHRSDIYSLGVVLYECLTGAPPHTADSFNELLFKIVLEEVPSARLRRPEIDEELDAILKHALAKAAEQRFQTAQDLEVALIDWMQKQGVKLGDWLTDSATRSLDPRATPTSAKRIPVAAESSGQIPIRSDAARDATLPDGRFRATESPIIVTSQSVTQVSPNTAKGKRTGVVVGGIAAVVAIVAGLGIALTRGGPPAAASAPTGLVETAPPPSAAAPKPTTETTATAAATGTTAPVDTASAVTTAKATSTGQVGAGTRPKGPTTAAATAAAGTASTKPTATAPAATASANVGGRTIRTDL